MKRLRRLTLVVLLAAVVPVAGTDAAWGGTYTIRSCDNASTSGWSHFDTGPGSLAWHICGYSIGGLTATAGQAAGAAASWTFTAPNHTELAGFSVRRSYTLPAPLLFGAGVYSLATDDWRSGYSSSRSSWDGPLSPAAATEWVVGLRGQRSLTAKVECAGGGQCAGPGSVTVWSAAIDLRDDLSPVVTSVSGGLLSAGGVAGTRTLSYSATDLGGGVYRERLRVDGEPVSDRRLECSFALAVPCPLSASETIALDTTKLTEGRHEVELELWDATLANRAVYGPVTVTVDNVAPPVMTSAPRVSGTPRRAETLSAHDGAWTGADVELTRHWQRLEGGEWSDIPGAAAPTYRPVAQDEGHRLRVRVLAANRHGTADGHSEPTAPVSAPEPEPGPVAAVPPARAVQPAEDSPPATVMAAFQATGGSSVRVRWGERRTVSGTVTRSDGQPVVGARVRVTSRSLARGSRAVEAGGVTTGAGGRFAYRPPVGASRTISFSYRASRATVTVNVIPRITIGLSRAGRLSGRITGAPEAVSKWVELQVASGGAWRTFATARLAPTGGTFTRSRVPHGRLRARVPAAPGWPFLTGTSGTATRRP